jgi:hypothetical protein
MTLGALEIKKVRRYFKNPELVTTASRSVRATTPLSGKALIHRLEGILSKEAANQLDRHINESCEQIDD